MVMQEHKSIDLDQNSYFDIERAAKKIAAEYDIDNVESVELVITANSGIVRFKQAGKVPGVPDGTGPMGGTDKCPMTKKKDKDDKDDKNDKEKEQTK